MITSPIYDWEDADVWNFIHDRKMKYNPLYDKGFERVGCVGCPLAGNQAKELEMYPIYKLNYIRAFDRMLKHRKENGKENRSWENGEEVFKWWIGDDSIKGQMDISDFLN